MSAEEKLILTDEEALRFTQIKRRELVNVLCDDGIPRDPKDRAMLLKALDGMDRQALTNKRIAGETAGNEAARMAAQAMNVLFEKLGNQNPFQKEGAGRVIDAPQKFVEKLELVPGETEIGIASLDYDSFSDPQDA